ncbi:MAG: tRNA lysidine(34) synthetase TilS [Actinomycetota bacterium]|nr:tRNA lysidine(34) synthetase TilS [Actinomycetota bacterium]
MRLEKERYIVLRRVEETVRSRGMVEAGDLVLVAVSGGADSLVLLDAVALLAEDLGVSLGVVHVDHGVRPCSGEDASFVREVAEHYRLPCHVERIEAVGGKGGKSPEEWLREERYRIFRSLIEETGARRLATGHTADDRVETFLLRILAGAGPRGLASIPPVRGPYVRPLIGVWRREVEEYARFLPFEPRLDRSNLDLSIPRNRVRHELLPLLEGRYNPAVKRTLLAEAEMFSEVAEALAGRTDEARARVVREEGGAMLLDVEAARALEVATLREVIAGMLRGLGRDPEFRLVEDIRLKLLEGDGNPSLELGGGLEARRSYGLVRMGPVEAVPEAPWAEIPGEGIYPLGGSGLTLKVAFREWRGGDPGREAPGGERAWLDADLLRFPLLVRGVRPGDRFHPLGAPGRRKLQDFLVDLKVPRERRREVLVLESGGEIAWVMGLRIDERFRVREGTRRVAELEVAGLTDSRGPRGR